MRQSPGFYPAFVVDNVDPDGRGRVRVRLLRAGEAGEESDETWARLATLMAGNNHSTWFVPDVDDEVLVAFEGGEAGESYVIGGLWSAASPPPATMDIDSNRKIIRSRNGVKVTLDDQSGQESFIVETPGGQRVRMVLARSRSLTAMAIQCCSRATASL